MLDLDAGCNNFELAPQVSQAAVHVRREIFDGVELDRHLGHVEAEDRQASVRDRLRRHLADANRSHRQVETLGEGIALDPDLRQPDARRSCDAVLPQDAADSGADTPRLDEQERELAHRRRPRERVEAGERSRFLRNGDAQALDESCFDGQLRSARSEEARLVPPMPLGAEGQVGQRVALPRLGPPERRGHGRSQ